MRIALGNDHAGHPARIPVIRAIEALGHEVVDCGVKEATSVDYPMIAAQVARLVTSEQADRGILICGTGIGMSIVANKFPGIRCACCTDEYSAQMSRSHNNSNILSLRARDIDYEQNEKIVRAWLVTEFEGGRHLRRVEQISQLEEEIAREICSKD